MATYTAGCSKVGSFNYANNFTLYVVLNDRDGNSGTNRSYVDYNVFCQSNGSGSIKANHQLYFQLNGNVIRNENIYVNVSSPNAYIGIASGTIEVEHDYDGNKTISFGASIQANSYGVSSSVSGNFGLNNIPRYLSSINIYNNGTALNSVSIKWTCVPNRDWTQYSLNGGGWTDAGDNVASDGRSGTFSIGGLQPNTTYSVRVRLRRADSGLWSESGTLYIATKNIANITNPNSNFSINNENSLKVDCTNPSGNDIAYFLDCPSGTRRLTSGKTKNTSYTWTAAQILSMLQYSTSSNSVSIKVGVITYGNSEYYSEMVGTLNVVNSNPTFNNFTYEDTDKNIIALTGSNQIIVKGYSDVKGIISNANKAIGKNSASMSKYRFVIGESQKEGTYSNNSNVEITISNAENNVFNMYAIDSRGNSTLKTISPSTYKNYSEINIKTLEAVRQNNGIGQDVLLIFSGDIWNNNFGKIQNKIVNCTYKYKRTTSNTWITGETTITPNVNGQGYTGRFLIKGDLGAEGFDVKSSYNLQVSISDRLSSASKETLIGTGTPGIAITSKGVAILNMYDEKLGGALQITGDLYVNGKKINN